MAGFGGTDADAEGDRDERPERMQTGRSTMTSVGDVDLLVTGDGAPALSACPYDSGAPYFEIH